MIAIVLKEIKYAITSRHKDELVIGSPWFTGYLDKKSMGNQSPLCHVNTIQIHPNAMQIFRFCLRHS
uniref:Uncharacterized protein n=1 Tax=Heterorhabditis bacteriophora TaxID=37862 RepID=A0A1I7WR44_HETBA